MIKCHSIQKNMDNAVIYL